MARNRGHGLDALMHTLSSQNNLKVATKNCKNKCLLVVTKNKKHSSKQVLPITHTGERVFAAATFQGCEWFLFRQCIKMSGILYPV